MIIYCYTNTVNQKKYVGQTNSWITRQYQHKWCAKHEKFDSIALEGAIVKYGMDNFTTEILEEVESIEEANLREQFWIMEKNSHVSQHGYNIDWGGKNRIVSEETKAKASATMKKYWATHDAPFKGKHLSEEHRRNISIGSIGKAGVNLGKTFDEEWCKKISRSQEGSVRLSTRRFDEATEKKICELYLSGRSQSSLGKEFNCYISLIMSILNRLGIKRRESYQNKSENKKKKFSDEQELQIYKEYEAGATKQKLGNKFGCKGNTISSIIRRVKAIQINNDTVNSMTV